MRQPVERNLGHAALTCEAIEFSGPRISSPDLRRQRADFGNLFPHSPMTPKLRCGDNSALGGTNAAAGFGTGSFSFDIDHLTSRKKRGQKQIGHPRRLDNANQ
jgi:hypothetical protein